MPSFDGMAQSWCRWPCQAPCFRQILEAVRNTSKVSDGGEDSTASGGADFVLGIVTKEAKATSDGTEGSRTLPPASSTTPSWSTNIDLGVCSLVQPNTCGEAGLDAPAIRREPWNATCTPTMAVLGTTPTDNHRPKLPDHLLFANACVVRNAGKRAMIQDPAALHAKRNEVGSSTTPGAAVPGLSLIHI